MIAFADASALVKLYADEPGASLVRGHRTLVVSSLSRVEVPAALWRKHRRGELHAEATALLVSDFEADYFGTPDEPPRFIAVAATAAVLDVAARLVASYALRAYDAVQLGSALAARTAEPDLGLFLAFDRALADAAAAEGMRLP